MNGPYELKFWVWNGYDKWNAFLKDEFSELDPFYFKINFTSGKYIKKIKILN